VDVICQLQHDRHSCFVIAAQQTFAVSFDDFFGDDNFAAVQRRSNVNVPAHGERLTAGALNAPDDVADLVLRKRYARGSQPVFDVFQYLVFVGVNLVDSDKFQKSINQFLHEFILAGLCRWGIQ
jgi:hypothetical protein